MYILYKVCYRVGYRVGYRVYVGVGVYFSLIGKKRPRGLELEIFSEILILIFDLIRK